MCAPRQSSFAGWLQGLQGYLLAPQWLALLPAVPACLAASVLASGLPRLVCGAIAPLPSLMSKSAEYMFQSSCALLSDQNPYLGHRARVFPHLFIYTPVPCELQINESSSSGVHAYVCLSLAQEYNQFKLRPPSELKQDLAVIEWRIMCDKCGALPDTFCAPPPANNSCEQPNGSFVPRRFFRHHIALHSCCGFRVDKLNASPTACVCMALCLCPICRSHEGSDQQSRCQKYRGTALVHMPLQHHVTCGQARQKGSCPQRLVDGDGLCALCNLAGVDIKLLADPATSQVGSHSTLGEGLCVYRFPQQPWELLYMKC